MNGNGSFTVTNLRVRQSPQLDASGNVFQATLVSFNVGPHGTFTVMFPPGAGSTQAITDAITATVNNIKALVQAIGTLNSQA
jgi:hypothetical protein